MNDRPVAQTLLGFLAEVAGVPLGDAGHDAVHQLAAGRLINVLGSRHQPHAKLTMIAESLISLALVGLVLASAVNNL